MSQEVKGVYRLIGIHDMAARFVFREDSSFGFMYSYGAVDRAATGKYSVQDTLIKLYSDKEPGKDFTIVKQDKLGDHIVIKVSDPNPYLSETVMCIAFEGENKHAFYADKHGVIRVDLPGADQLYVQHQLYPDIVTLVRAKGNPNNYFELTLNPSLAYVSFKGIDLTINGDTLTCLPNYFMPFENIRFVKE